MLGSIDCMHWMWKNCSIAWHGQFKGKEKVASLVIVVNSDIQSNTMGGSRSTWEILGYTAFLPDFFWYTAL